MRKSIWIVMLIAVLLFPACVGKTSDTAAEETGVVTLRISHNMDFTTIPEAFVDAAARLNERYAQEGRDLRIEFEKDYQTIDWVEYQNSITFAHQINDAPDIYAIMDPSSLVKAGALLDITDVISENQDKFVEGVFNGATENGKIYAFAPDLPIRVVYYNTDVLRKLGWTEDEISSLPGRISSGEFSFEEFMALCEEAVEKGASKWGMAHRPGTGDDFLDILKVLGGEYYDENNKLVIDTEGLLRFFEFFYRNANETQITPTNLNQMGWSNINKMVATGEAFAYYGPVYSATYVFGSIGSTVDEFVKSEDFAMFPVSQWSAKPFVTAAPQYVGISSQTKHPEICRDLIRELANGSSDLLARHAAKINSLSSVKAANENPAVLDNPIIRDVTYMADYAVTNPIVKGKDAFLVELSRQIVALELNQTTPEKAVEAMKTQISLSTKDVIVK